MRCVRGALFDVLVDLRCDSPTFGRWFATELTAENLRATYIPAGFAHGFQTLEDDTDVLYQISTPDRAEARHGVRWDDSSLDISWPLPPVAMSERDASWPGVDEVGDLFGGSAIQSNRARIASPAGTRR